MWNTTNVVGRDSRDKYHVFICDEDWQFDNLFLFINKGSYGNCCPLTNAPPCSFLPLPQSYIDCTRPIFYTTTELGRFSGTPVGQLNVPILRQLRVHIEASRIMERRYKSRILSVLP